MRVLIEWFGETGLPQGATTINDVDPTTIGADMRRLVAQAFKDSDNLHAAGLVSVLDCDTHEMIKLPLPIRPGGRFLVTRMTQGNWGNGNLF
jgi:hypothetical protein